MTIWHVCRRCAFLFAAVLALAPGPLRAATIVEETLGPNHTQTAAALAGLAQTMHRMGNHYHSEALYRRCVQIVERIGGR